MAQRSQGTGTLKILRDEMNQEDCKPILSVYPFLSTKYPFCVFNSHEYNYSKKASTTLLGTTAVISRLFMGDDNRYQKYIKKHSLQLVIHMTINYFIIT